MQVSVELSLENICFNVKSGECTVQDHVCVSQERPPYILIGWNNAVKQTLKHRIPLIDKVSKRIKCVGIIPNTKETLKNWIHAALQASLMITIHSNDKCRKGPQRHAKVDIVFLSDLMESQQSIPCEMTNKCDPMDVLCSFTVNIHGFDLSNRKILKPYYLTADEAFEARKRAWDELEQECVQFEAQSRESEKLYSTYDPSHFLCVTSEFFGREPLFNYLNTDLTYTNEDFWCHMKETVMLLHKTNKSLSIDTDTNQCCQKMDVYDLLAQADYMYTLIPNMVPYLPDAMIDSNGKLDYSRDDHSENPNEGPDDCDGKASMVTHFSMVFQNHVIFKDPILEEIRQLEQCYIRLAVTADMLEYEKSMIHREFHLTTVGVLKHEFYNALTRLIYPGSQFDPTGKGVSKQLSELIREEKKQGNLKTHVVRNGKKELLPLARVGEGVYLLYPYPLEVHAPSEIELQKHDDAVDILNMASEYSGLHILYQFKEKMLVTQFYMAFTTYFVKHPTHPVNLPSINLTTFDSDGKCTWEKGIGLYDLFVPGRMGGFPQAHLRDLNKSMELLNGMCLYKFGFCPCKGTLSKSMKWEVTSRIDHGQYTLITSPNIMPDARKKIVDQIPKTFEGYHLFFIPSGIWPVLMKEMNVNTVSHYIVTWEHVTLYAVWCEISDNKKND